MTVSNARLLSGVPREARRLLIGQAFSSLGDGVLMPLLLIYLYRVQGLSLPVASLIVAIAPLTTFLLTLPAGALIDRFGPHRALRLSAVIQTVAVAMLAGASTTPLIVAAVVLKSAAEAAYWPAGSSLLAALATDRERAFGLRFLMVNVGVGLGGIVVALFADTSDPLSYQLMILFDALTFLVLWFCVPPAPRDSPASGADEPETPGTYRAVLADRRFVLLLVAMVVLMTVGYGQMDAGIPAFIVDEARLADSAIGLAFTANTVVVVVVQLLVLRRLGNSDARRSLALVAVAWAASWAVLAVSLLTGVTGTIWALVAVLGSQVIFAAAETILQPVNSALVNNLAPVSMRGRYNAASALSWNAGFFAGPALSGVLLGHFSGAWYVVVMGVGCLVAGALILGLRRGLPATSAQANEAGPATDPANT